MLRRVALVRTYVSDELSASIIRAIITLMMEALSSSETSVLTKATRRKIPEEAILYLERPKYRLKSITAVTSGKGCGGEGVGQKPVPWRDPELRH
jgi:hypothetical protein